MSLRFSDAGPAFPPQLVEALLSGDVVFFCGAGISAPQLPGFSGLVTKCFERLNVEMDPSETLSFKDFRFEEVLGTLRRRIVDPGALIETVSDLLSPPNNADLSHHRTIIRLSKGLNNKPIIVTTNFDNLIEHALLEHLEKWDVQRLSFAGQALPLPGSAEFFGIIHLHGRLADEAVGVNQTPLVLTSSDYGDAYMRSAWASRFLFDLVRCKTIVLIGYSAGDAPVRYFLNVLEADRERFPELRPVYAFDSVIGDLTEADARWRTLAVTPLPYKVIVDETNYSKSYDALWRDLGTLADLIERPKPTRTAWAREILSSSLVHTNEVTQDRIRWLFGGHSDLLHLLVECVQDPSWFDFFHENGLWDNSNAQWCISAWIKEDFASSERYHIALKWYSKLGRPLLKNISSFLIHDSSVSEFWTRAWKLFIQSDIRRHDHDLKWYSVQIRLRKAPVLFSDLIDAVSCLTPTLSFSERYSLYGRGDKIENPTRINELARAEFNVPDMHAANEILSLLLQSDQIVEICQIAMGCLETVQGISKDAELVDDLYDANDFAVPSIEESSQNQYHNGVLFLVRLLAEMLPRLAAEDRTLARRYAQRSRQLPGRVGTRLWLHTLRFDQIFDPDEAIFALIKLTEQDFWASRPEMPYVIRDRAKLASPVAAKAVEERIIGEASQHYQRYEIEEGQVDWRDYARDSGVWLRLSMLRAADALSAGGQEALSLIEARRADLVRPTEDRDFFGSYSFGVRSVVGNAKPIKEATAENRIKIALDNIQSNQLENQHGWSAYCQSDIRGAFETLSRAPLNEVNSRLWRDYLSALNFSITSKPDEYLDLVESSFDLFTAASDSFLFLVINQLSSLYWSVKERSRFDSNNWWNRLFGLAVEHGRSDEISHDLFSRAINSASGQLMQTVIDELDKTRKAKAELPQALIERLTTGSTSTGRGGLYAQAIILRDAQFVLSIEGERASGHLRDILSTEDFNGTDLRAVLLSGQYSPKVCSTFKRQILTGVLELKSDEDAISTAAMILGPPLNVLMGHGSDSEWGITANDASRALKSGSTSLRQGALSCLRQWLRVDEDKERLWRKGIGPLLLQIWPRELRFRNEASSGAFAAISVGVGMEFPAAFAQIRPFLTPLKGQNIHFDVESSDIAENFPSETLDLLWTICGPESDRRFHSMPEILAKIVAVKPKIESDRRFQWLQQNVIQYG